MLDDRYSLLDYLKFICNAKVRYEPRRRSYLQPVLYYCLAAVLISLSFGVITVDNALVFWAQATTYTISVALFTSLILPPKQHEKHHTYGHYAER